MLSISRSNIRCSQPVHVNRVQTPRQVDVPILARNAGMYMGTQRPPGYTNLCNHPPHIPPHPALATALSLTLMTSSATAAEVQQVFQNSCAGMLNSQGLHNKMQHQVGAHYTQAAMLVVGMWCRLVLHSSLLIWSAMVLQIQRCCTR